MLKRSLVGGVFSRSSVVAIGKFDVIHNGHINILKTLVNLALTKNLLPIVVVLHPNPIDFFTKQKSKVLYKVTQRYKIIKSFFLEHKINNFVCLVQKFDKDFASLTPFDFVNQYLKKQLKATHVVCGSNFCFGKAAAGDVNFLKEHINCTLADDFLLPNGECISSTIVKNLVQQGDVLNAVKYCYQKICYCGFVSRGMGLAGGALGFKTANVVFNTQLNILPKFGVYQCVVEIANAGKVSTFNGICNIGVKPTFKHNFGDNKAFVEVNIFDFNDNIYGKKINIYLHRFIREEKKFNGIDDLKNQIKLDIEFCLNIINKSGKNL